MKLLLLDGNSLTYRAFYALPTDMATASGQVTNAVFGFTSMFAYLLKDQHPDGVMVAFDRPEKTFRHDSNPLYKAQREAAPDILRQQMGLVREVLDALHVNVVELAGWEADDILATVAEQAKAEGHEVIIVTGDRDSYQLVEDPGVKVLYNRRGVSDYALYDEAGIKEKTGVTPAQYTAIRGPARRSERQPRRCSGRGGEDRSKAHQHLWRARRDLCQRRGTDAKAARLTGRTRRPGPQQRRVDDPASQCTDRGRSGCADDRARRRRGSPVVRLPGVPSAHRQVVRSARHAGVAATVDRAAGVGSRDH